MYIHIYTYINRHHTTSHYMSLPYVTLHTHTHTQAYTYTWTYTHTCDMCIHSTLKTYVQVGTNTIYIDIQDTNY